VPCVLLRGAGGRTGCRCHGRGLLGRALLKGLLVCSQELLWCSHEHCQRRWTAPASAAPQQAKLWGPQGEVLAGLQQKLKYSERERTFCCLVAESAARPGALAGVVEVSLQGEVVRRARPAPSRTGCLRAGAVARPCTCGAKRKAPKG